MVWGGGGVVLLKGEEYSHHPTSYRYKLQVQQLKSVPYCGKDGVCCSSIVFEKDLDL